MKHLTLLVLSSATLVWGAAPAWALDAYQDRKGPFLGLGVGGGGGATDTDNVEVRDGAGLVLMGRGGGGISQGMTMDLSFVWFTRDRAGHGLLAAAGNLFLTEELFVRLGVGLGKGEITDKDGDTLQEDFNLGVLAGGGVEFFLNANMAASLTVQVQRHTMGSVRYSGAHGFAGLTWY